MKPNKYAKIVATLGPASDDRATIQALFEAGAVPRLVGQRIGPFVTAEGETLQADASMENEPAPLFDALVLPDGERAVKALAVDGRAAEFVKEQYRHCKPILALGASSSLLEGAGASKMLPDGSEDPGVIAGEEDDDARERGWAEDAPEQDEREDKVEGLGGDAGELPEALGDLVGVVAEEVEDLAGGGWGRVLRGWCGGWWGRGGMEFGVAAVDEGS